MNAPHFWCRDTEGVMYDVLCSYCAYFAFFLDVFFETVSSGDWSMSKCFLTQNEPFTLL